MKTQVWVGRIAVLMTGTLIALFLAEAGARYYEHHRLQYRNDRPDYIVNPGFLHKGRRDRVHSVAKPAGVKRVLFIGDSLTYGTDVQFEDAYPARVERILNRTQNRTRFEVLNFARPGASTLDELNQLEEGLKYDPDYVILGYFLNDPDSNPSLYISRLLHHPAGSAHPRLYRISALYRILERALVLRATVHGNKHYVINLYRKGSNRYRIHLKALRTMKRRLAARKVPFFVVFWPALWERQDDHYMFASIHDRMNKYFHGLGVPVLDLRSAFHGMDHRRLEAIPGVDAHPSEIAHRIAAETLVAWMRKDQHTWPIPRANAYVRNMYRNIQVTWFTRVFPRVP